MEVSSLSAKVRGIAEIIGDFNSACDEIKKAIEAKGLILDGIARRQWPTVIASYSEKQILQEKNIIQFSQVDAKYITSKGAVMTRTALGSYLDENKIEPDRLILGGNVDFSQMDGILRHGVGEHISEIRVNAQSVQSYVSGDGYGSYIPVQKVDVSANEGYCGFSDCNYMNQASVKIGGQVPSTYFADCNSLSSVTVDGSQADVFNLDIYDCPNIRDVKALGRCRINMDPDSRNSLTDLTVSGDAYLVDDDVSYVPTFHINQNTTVHYVIGQQENDQLKSKSRILGRALDGDILAYESIRLSAPPNISVMNVESDISPRAFHATIKKGISLIPSDFHKGNSLGLWDIPMVTISASEAGNAIGYRNVDEWKFDIKFGGGSFRTESATATVQRTGFSTGTVTGVRHNEKHVTVETWEMDEDGKQHKVEKEVIEFHPEYIKIWWEGYVEAGLEGDTVLWANANVSLKS